MIDIRNIQGNVIYSTEINVGAKRKFQLMKEDYITLPFSLEEPKTFDLGSYVDIDAGLFEVVDTQKPTLNASTGGYDYQLRLDAYYWKWKNKIFKYTPQNGGQEASWSLTATLDVHLGILIDNLNALGYKYRGASFEFSIDSTVENSAKVLTYENINMIDALSMLAEAWECEWWITDNIIHFGRCEYGTPVDFEIGVNVAEMSRTESSSKYATRLYVFGSTRNLPPNYRAVDESVVVNGVVQRRLMLPQGIKYIDAYENMSQEEAIEEVVILEDIYPKTDGNISSMETYTPPAVENEDGTTIEETFYRFKDNGIRFSKDFILEGSELRALFTSGSLNGMEFGLVFNPNGKEESIEEAQLFEIVANEDYGRKLPDTVLHPKVGDKYILIGWDSTKIADLGLVSKAEEQLYQEGLKLSAKRKIDPNTYGCKMYSDYMYGLNPNGEQDEAYSKHFEVGDKVNLINAAYFDNGRQSRIIGYEYNLDYPFDNPVYTIGETASYSRLGALESKLDALTYGGQTYTGKGGSGVYVIGTNDVTKATDRNVYSALRTDKTYLSKTKDDRSKGVIASDKGFEAGVFTSGATGVGVYQNADGQWVIETDNLSVRRKFSANEVEIQTTNHIGGQTLLTAARMVIESVDEMADRFRCIYRKRDGEGNVISQQWKVGDLAFCNTFNLEKQADGAIGNHYYWREVVEVSANDWNEDYYYVDLSKTKCASGSSEPKQGDKVVQLGYSKNDDANRQNAIIIAGAGTGSPYIQLFVGINSFVLPEPEQLKPGDNRLSGRLTIKEGSTGWENLEGLKGVINKQSSDLESFANSVTKEFENIRNEMDGAIDTWFGEEVPTLNNYPAVDWITEDDMDSHLGDLCYSSNGKAYRFQYTETDGYHWSVIEDSEVVKALELAQKALDTADGKRRVFISQPIPPYDLGDLWAGGDNAPLMRCVVARESGSFYEDDWDLADNSQKYADAIKTKLEQDLNSAKADIDQAIVNATNASKGYTDEAKAAIQASINSLEQNKADLSAVYEKAIVDGMVNDAEAEAIRQANEVAQAQRVALEARVNAYADGQISEAEQRAIDEADRLVEEAKKEFHASITATKNTIDQTISDVQGAMTSYTDEAKQALQASITQLEQAKANVDDVYSKTLIDGKVTALEEFATNEATEYAKAAREAAETNVKAWADGVIDEAEQNAINEAQKKVDAAKEDLEAAMDALEGDLTTLINNTKNNLDDAIAKAKNEAESNANNYTDEGKAALQASINALNETKANISNVYTKSESDGKISQAETDAIAAAKVAADAAILASEAVIKAYADGIVSAEEQSRITEAQNNLAEAKRYAEEKAAEAFNDAEDLVDNLEGGKENLLRNTGFFGDYVSASLLGEVVLSETSEMYSPSLQHWTSSLATAVEMSESESGKGVRIENGGFIQQSMFHPVTDGEKYVFSFRGKGGSVRMSVGQYSKTFTLSSSFGLYFEKFVANGSTRIIKIEATGTCELCELQLERGTIRSAWGMSPLDNQSAQAQYESMTYLKQAIDDGSSEFVGGLALANLLFAKDMSGNVKAGMSGIYNDDHSVAFFGGGNYEQAIATALKYANNPSYQASESEIQNMAKFVVTHGGRAILNDVVLRGYIYALGGKFKGEIEATSGVFKNVASPNNYFNIDENGNADFRGGKIGNFEVSGGWLGIKASQTEQIGTNSLMALMNNGIVFNSATRRALLGVISSSGSEYLGKFEDKTQHIASNRGLWFDVQNSSTANLAFFGDGAGVLNGMMCGYGVQIIKPTDNSIYPIGNLTNGNVIIVDSIITSYLAFPTIKEVRNAIELGSGNFAVKLTVIKKGRNSVHIYGRGSLGDSTNYPNVSYMEVGANEAASFILYYDGSDYNVVRL